MNTSPRLLKTAITWFLVIALAVSTFLIALLLAGQSKEILSWLHQFIATLVSAALALSLGLFLYRLQLQHQRRHTYRLLKKYLYYVSSRLSDKTVRERGEAGELKVNARSLNTAILNQVILDSDYEHMFDDLIELQNYVELYSQAVSDLLFELGTISKDANSKDAESLSYQLRTMENLADATVDAARSCIEKLETNS